MRAVGHGRSLAFLACVAWASLAQGVTYVDDPLTASSHPGRGQKGGTFSASGWTTTNEPDSIWYEIDEALPTARVEYTVEGISTTTTLTGTDHDIFTVYAAPTGQAEPIPYSPYFRNNDFKAFTRLFGQKEPGRNGAIKLELAACPRGAPWHHDDPCTAACEMSGIAYAFGTDKDIGWDGTKAYRMAIEWSPGKMTFFRDNVELGTVNFSGSYAPKPIRVRLGSPRHDGIYPTEAMMPIGLTFRDVLVTGTPGAPTPVCGTNPATDGGAGSGGAAGGSGGTGGSGGSGGGTSTLSVLADVTAASWESGVFSDVNDLNVEGDASGAPAAVVYLRFPAVSGTVDKAILRLHATTSPSAAGGSGTVCVVQDSSWDENTMTWATRPTVSSSCAGVSTSVDPDTDVEWDVTSLITPGGVINLAIVSADPNGAHFFSKEGSTTQAPQLTVTTSGGTSDAGVGGGGGSGGAGTGGAATGGGAGAPPRGGTSGEDDGCGCRVAGRAGSATLSFAAALALLAVGRRRRRRVVPPPSRTPQRVDPNQQP